MVLNAFSTLLHQNNFSRQKISIAITQTASKIYPLIPLMRRISCIGNLFYQVVDPKPNITQRNFHSIDQTIHKAHLDCALRACVCYTNMVSSPWLVVLCFFFAKMKFHYPFSSSGSVQSSATYKVSFPPQVQSHDLFGCFFPSSSCCITHAV